MKIHQHHCSKCNFPICFTVALGGNEPGLKKAETEVVSLGVQDQLRVAKAIRQQTVEKLWEITEKLNILYKDNWTALADREMVKFQTQLFAQKKDSQPSSLSSKSSDDKRYPQDQGSKDPNTGILATTTDNVEAKNHEEWSFTQSFLYSLTLITTVGKCKKSGPQNPCFLAKVIFQGFMSLSIFS